MASLTPMDIPDRDQIERFYQEHDVVVGWKENEEIIAYFGANTEMNRAFADLFLEAIKQVPDANPSPDSERV